MYEIFLYKNSFNEKKRKIEINISKSKIKNARKLDKSYDINNGFLIVCLDSFS